MRSIRLALRDRLRLSSHGPTTNNHAQVATAPTGDSSEAAPEEEPIRPPLLGSANHKIYGPIPITKTDVRNLVLLPGEPGSPICCTLECVSWLDPTIPEYEALSYAWGDCTLSRKIWVNGEVMRISQNLESALEHLRFPFDTRNLWVDAICIDQGNVIERNEQVSIMRDIYRNSRRVLVWLGENTENSDLAFDLIDTLSADVHEVGYSMSWLEMASLTDKEKKRHTKLASLESPISEIPEVTMQALRETFIQRAWWQRIWVIQEVVSARNALILCGDRSFSWDLLEKLLEANQRTVLSRYTEPRVRAQLASTMHSAILFTAVRNQYKESMASAWNPDNGVYKAGMCSLLALFETNLCTDPRDRVFALQNITASAAEQVEPDYRKPTLEIFAQSTKAIIKSSHSLEVLAYTYRSVATLPGKPSWAPNWSVPREFATLISAPMKDPLYEAWTRSEHTSTALEKAGHCPFWMLGIRGYMRDEIAEVLQVVDKENPRWRDWFRTWLPQDLNTSTSFVLSQESIQGTLYNAYPAEFDVYLRCLMLDVYRQTGWPSRIKLGPAMHHYRHLFLSWTEHPRYSSFEKVPSPFQKAYGLEICPENNFDECMSESLHGWAFIKTRSGSLGWVPQTARVGDLVCLADGSPLPLILREAGPDLKMVVQDYTQDDRFELVGSAYIHGQMDTTQDYVSEDVYLV